MILWINKWFWFWFWQSYFLVFLFSFSTLLHSLYFSLLFFWELNNKTANNEMQNNPPLLFFFALLIKQVLFFISLVYVTSWKYQIFWRCNLTICWHLYRSKNWFYLDMTTRARLAFHGTYETKKFSERKFIFSLYLIIHHSL